MGPVRLPGATVTTADLQAGPGRPVDRRPDEPLVTAMRARTLEELGRPAEAAPLWREVARQVPEGVVGQAARERTGR